jgi:hypothetical protein
MEYTTTLRYMKLYVGYAYLLGMSPIRFDNLTKTLFISSSTVFVIRSGITMCIMVSHRVAVVVFILRDIMNHSIGFQDKFDIIRITITLISMYCLGNYMHNYWKGSEIKATLNSFFIYYNNFQSKHV